MSQATIFAPKPIRPFFLARPAVSPVISSTSHSSPHTASSGTTGVGSSFQLSHSMVNLQRMNLGAYSSHPYESSFRASSPAFAQLSKGVGIDSEPDEELVAIVGWTPSQNATSSKWQHLRKEENLQKQRRQSRDNEGVSSDVDEEDHQCYGPDNLSFETLFSMEDDDTNTDTETLRESNSLAKKREFYSSTSRFPFSYSPPKEHFSPFGDDEYGFSDYNDEEDGSGVVIPEVQERRGKVIVPPSRSSNPMTFYMDEQGPPDWDSRTSTRSPLGAEMGVLSMSPPLHLPQMSEETSANNTFL